ncbi:MAG: hypothetical protein IAE91_07800 [Ignavibacteriaceae bacterium]|nr:hypothetical protein [Ignavibacteriaceae bacterium]
MVIEEIEFLKNHFEPKSEIVNSLPESGSVSENTVCYLKVDGTPLINRYKNLGGKWIFEITIPKILPELPAGKNFPEFTSCIVNEDGIYTKAIFINGEWRFNTLL